MQRDLSIELLAVLSCDADARGLKSRYLKEKVRKELGPFASTHILRFATHVVLARVIRKVLRRDIDAQRIYFYHTSCIPRGFRHEELLSTDKRLEFLGV